VTEFAFIERAESQALSASAAARARRLSSFVRHLYRVFSAAA